LYADVGIQDTYTAATLTSAATVTDNGSADILLATADSVYAGEAGINNLGGAFENVTTTSC